MRQYISPGHVTFGTAKIKKERRLISYKHTTQDLLQVDFSKMFLPWMEGYGESDDYHKINYQLC